jgi:uncharacterized membrane protein YkvA (DUF1232 family)
LEEGFNSTEGIDLTQDKVKYSNASSPNVSNAGGKEKKTDWALIGLIIFTIAYVLSPIDLIPEGLLGPLGFADDAALIAYLLKRIIDKIRK